MKQLIYIIIITSTILVACTKNNYIDTGISNGRHEGKNMLEYMEAHSYDWDSTLMMIHHAGADIVRLFEGKDSHYKEITFFGITNHSIRRYLLQRGYDQVSDLDPEWCKSILKQHVLAGKLYRNDIPAGKPGLYGTVGTGGQTFTTLAGTEVWVYVHVKVESGITQHAAKPIYINFKKSSQQFAVASGNIEPDNGVIHALEYAFTLGDEE